MHIHKFVIIFPVLLIYNNEIGQIRDLLVVSKQMILITINIRNKHPTWAYYEFVEIGKVNNSSANITGIISHKHVWTKKEYLSIDPRATGSWFLSATLVQESSIWYDSLEFMPQMYKVDKFVYINSQSIKLIKLAEEYLSKVRFWAYLHP